MTIKPLHLDVQQISQIQHIQNWIIDSYLPPPPHYLPNLFLLQCSHISVNSTICLGAKVKILENNPCIIFLSSSISNTTRFVVYTFKIYSGTNHSHHSHYSHHLCVDYCSSFLPGLPTSSLGDRSFRTKNWELLKMQNKKAVLKYFLKNGKNFKISHLMNKIQNFLREKK